MLEAELAFDGCSCGCTPAQTYMVSATDIDSLHRICAYHSSYFTAVGEDPYRKIHMTSEEDDFDEAKVFAYADYLCGLRDQISTAKAKLSDLKHMKPPFRCSSGFCLTKEQTDINALAEVDKTKAIQQVRAKIVKDEVAMAEFESAGSCECVA